MNFEKFPIVSIDTETTGVDKYAEIVEITITEFNIKGKIGESITFMCEPLCGFIPSGASKVNGIYFEDVVGKPSYLTGGVREQCIELIGDRPSVYHNAPFDTRMMRIEFDEDKVFCTLKRARKEWPRGKCNLRACINKIGGEWDNSKAHRAEYDVEKCIELYLHFYGDTPEKMETEMEL